jgi:2,4-dienoyl-CoA reductase (NADPH2)
LQDFDEIVLSTGVVPRKIKIEGSEGENVSLYNAVLTGEKQIGARVAIIGAGGIGFDMATYLLHGKSGPDSIENFMAEWGVDMEYAADGGLGEVQQPVPARHIYLLQRKKTKPGAGLGKTTGWIHRSVLKKNKVKILNGVEYLAINEQGLLIRHDGHEQLLEVDDVVVCAGQLSELELAGELDELGIRYHLIGGALKAGELDAQRAIEQGTELADQI